jgi:D-lactate dehydrogenase (cytochrome)
MKGIRLKFNSVGPDHISYLKTLVPDDRLSTGESVLDLHAKDQSQHAAVRPEAVIWPLTAEEVAAVVKYANDNRIPIVGWGSGSSLEGNPIPVEGGIVLDFAQMNRIMDIRAEAFQADVEPGVIYQDLNEKLRHTGLFFPPDPGARATLGGMIANNASGTRTVYYGSTKDYVLRLSVVLANGETIELRPSSSAIRPAKHHRDMISSVFLSVPREPWELSSVPRCAWSGCRPNFQRPLPPSPR